MTKEYGSWYITPYDVLGAPQGLVTPARINPKHIQNRHVLLLYRVGMADLIVKEKELKVDVTINDQHSSVHIPSSQGTERQRENILIHMIDTLKYSTIIASFSQ